MAAVKVVNQFMVKQLLKKNVDIATTDNDGKDATFLTQLQCRVSVSLPTSPPTHTHTHTHTQGGQLFTGQQC